MPIFILFSLTISLLQQINSSYLLYFKTDLMLYLGITSLLLSFIATLTAYLKHHIRYDLFAAGALLVWYGSWVDYFPQQAPMFYFFPLYFCLITTFVTIFIIYPHDNFDEDTIALMHVVDKLGILRPGVIMVLVIISLQLKTQFLLYPITMTLLIISFTLTSCCKQE